MKDVRTLVISGEGGGGDWDYWLEVAWAYGYEELGTFLLVDEGNGWLDFTLKLLELDYIVSCKNLLFVLVDFRCCSSL